MAVRDTRTPAGRTKALYTRPPINQVKLEFWAGRNNNPTDSPARSAAALKEAADANTWKVAFTGQVVSVADIISSKVDPNGGICVQGTWEWLPGSEKLPGAHCVFFHVPIPAEQLRSEYRMFRMKANIRFSADELSLKEFDVCSGVVDVPVESLRKELHMDGKPLLHRNNVPVKKHA